MSASVTELRPPHHPQWRALDALVKAALSALAPDDAAFEDFGLTRPQLRHLTRIALAATLNQDAAHIDIPLEGPTMDEVCARYRPWMSTREVDL